MKSVDALDGVSRLLRRDDFVDHVDALDDQYVLLELDLSARHTSETLDGDLARFQRASEGTGQSAGRSGHDVIERRGVRLDLRRINLVVLSHSAMNAES